jgi:hypothetical protein
MKLLSKIIILVLVINTASFTQTKSKTINGILDGTWSVDLHIITSINKPEVNKVKLFQTELINPIDTIITFDNSNFFLNTSKKGSFKVKGNLLYLDNIKYSYTQYSKSKIKLIRIINPDLMIGYTLIRKQ